MEVRREEKSRKNKSFSGPDYAAVEKVMDQFSSGTRVCPCEPACAEELFPASVTSVKWPGKKYKVSILLYYVEGF